MKLLLFTLMLSLSPIATASSLNADQMSYWNKLLHYRPNLLGQMESEVDSLDFFVSKEGKKSPEKEFKAFIFALNSNKAQEYVCKFPLRYKWLKKNTVNNWNFTTQNCAIYNSFVAKLDAKNLSLVFSSFYIKNPGSTFGHTFIRVSRYKDFHHNEMLDYAFNFSAEKSDDNAFLYMFKGLAGYYKGQFSSLPYYYKIKEYSDYEFRDLWDYDLGLSQEQVDRVVDHIWEMGSIYFDYFYFTENCSYHILGLLNVAYNDVDILDGLSSIYVLPIDTVKEMKKLDLIKERKVRVSAYGKLLKEADGLKSKELNLVKSIAEKPESAKDILKNYSDKEAAEILDASVSALDYLKAGKVLLGDKKTAEEREFLLVMRAENPHLSEDLKFNVKKMHAPDDAHDSSRLGIFAGDRYKQGAFTGFEWRAAQHELLDPSQGHLKNSQVIMFDIKFRHQTIGFDSQRFILDRFRMLDIKKYQPSDFWNSSISFDMAIGLDQRKDCRSKNCVDPILTLGVGNSVALSNDHVLTFLLGGSYLFDKVYENNSLLSLGPKINYLILSDHFSLGLDAGYFIPTELFKEWQKRRVTYDLDFRYFIERNTSLFFKTSHVDEKARYEHETQVGIYFYH